MPLFWFCAFFGKFCKIVSWWPLQGWRVNKKNTMNYWSRGSKILPNSTLTSLTVAFVSSTSTSWTSPVNVFSARFIRPVAHVGSGDPVRVLRLYITNTLDEACSIYCWDTCTTCRYQSMCYSTGTSGPTALSVCSRLCLVCVCVYYFFSYCTVRCLL